MRKVQGDIPYQRRNAPKPPRRNGYREALVKVDANYKYTKIPITDGHTHCPCGIEYKKCRYVDNSGYCCQYCAKLKGYI